MKKSFEKNLLIIILTLVYAEAKSQPTFNCEKAKSPSEKIICSDQELAAMDIKLNELVKAARRNISDIKNFNKDTVDAWKKRESECHDRECVRKWYTDRIAIYSNDGANRQNKIDLQPPVQSAQKPIVSNIDGAKISQNTKIEGKNEKYESVSNFKLREERDNFGTPINFIYTGEVNEKYEPNGRGTRITKLDESKSQLGEIRTDIGNFKFGYFTKGISKSSRFEGWYKVGEFGAYGSGKESLINGISYYFQTVEVVTSSGFSKGKKPFMQKYEKQKPVGKPIDWDGSTLMQVDEAILFRP